MSFGRCSCVVECSTFPSFQFLLSFPLWFPFVLFFFQVVSLGPPATARSPQQLGPKSLDWAEKIGSPPVIPGVFSSFLVFPYCS